MKIFYVIRHKPSGALLPAHVQATKYNFDLRAGTYEPRLFKSERDAKRCATCWAKGVWSKETTTEPSDWERQAYAYPDAVTPVPGRLRDDLEVVPARLEILEP